MTPSLEFDPSKYSEATLRLIMLRAQEWQCTPAEAVVRLIEQLASKTKPRNPAAA